MFVAVSWGSDTRLYRTAAELRVQVRGRFVEDQIGEPFRITRAVANRCFSPPEREWPQDVRAYLAAVQIR